MRHTLAILATLALAACSTTGPGAPPTAGSAAADDLLKESPACAAAKLKPASPLPASALSDDVLRKAQSGWVAVRYDVVAGKAQNLKVVSSNPPGLYDTQVLRHASTYAEPTGTTVRGCLMTVHIRF